MAAAATGGLRSGAASPTRRAWPARSGQLSVSLDEDEDEVKNSFTHNLDRANSIWAIGELVLTEKKKA
jgi:hypothetical protein